MSVRKQTIKYGAAAAVLALAIITGSSFLAGSSVLPGSQSSVQGPSSLLVIQLTDPPHVPYGTTSLNLTYSSLDLLVGEPTGVNNQVNTKTIAVTPSGGSATLDLLKLQNVSQTIGAVSIPDGSVIYSVTFAVSGVSIDVNGTKSPVTLSSGTSFTVAMSSEHALHGTNTVLLQLNPVVADTPTGYQLIPSAVGALRLSAGQGEERIGYRHDLTGSDFHDLDQAASVSSVSSNLIGLSVSGNVTTLTVQVNNTGSGPVQLNAIGVQGNFTAQGSMCSKGESSHMDRFPSCWMNDRFTMVVFVPIIPAPSTTTTTTSTTTTSSTTTASNTCLTGQIALLNGDPAASHDGGLVLSPGECINLTYKGTISFGESAHALIPSTLPGQAYSLHILASPGASIQLDCVLPTGAASCKQDKQFMQY